MSTSSFEFVGEMMPWVQNYFGECIKVRITDPLQDELINKMIPEKKTVTAIGPIGTE